MDKKEMLNAVRKNYSGVDNGYESMTRVMSSINKNYQEPKIPNLDVIKKDEYSEATGAGSEGAFVTALEGEIDEKWSTKYKKSIDCNNPKGFSQRAHCQGKKKKSEFKEATGSSSSGSYETPAFGAKSMSPKHWRGASKTQIPGGAFVQVKKKCKTFPYCNQGDINALNISKKSFVRKKKKQLAEKYGVSENVIMDIIIRELKKNNNK